MSWDSVMPMPIGHNLKQSPDYSAFLNSYYNRDRNSGIVETLSNLPSENNETNNDSSAEGNAKNSPADHPLTTTTSDDKGLERPGSDNEPAVVSEKHGDGGGDEGESDDPSEGGRMAYPAHNMWGGMDMYGFPPNPFQMYPMYPMSPGYGPMMGGMIPPPGMMNGGYMSNQQGVYRKKRKIRPVEEGEEDQSDDRRVVQGQVSIAVKTPSPENRLRREAVEAELNQTMNDSLFTLKCKIYRRELNSIISEYSASGPRGASPSERRCHIPQFESLPDVQLNAMEMQYLVDLGEYADKDQLLKVMNDECPNQAGKSYGAVLQELLNSVSNRLLFLIMVEYRSWFPQERARLQIVQAVKKAYFRGKSLFSDYQDDSYGTYYNAPELQVEDSGSHEEDVKKETKTRKSSSDDSIPKELINYINAFVMQRSKNYRDVISRVTKRVRV